MATTSLSLTQKLRENLKNAEARAIISFLVTLGYILLNVLYALGHMPDVAYAQIMLYMTPLQAVIVGFYFGAPKSDITKTEASSLDFDKILKSIDILRNSLAQILDVTRQHDSEIKTLKSKIEG